MIIAFANKKLEVTKEEKEYLLSLKDTFGEDIFIDIFTTDKDGLITAITPPMTKPIQIIVIFSLLNLMLNQRLRKIDISRIEQLEERIAQLEKDFDEEE